MKQGIQKKIAKQFSSNVELNKKSLSLKSSWDEVASLLKIEKNNKEK